MAQYEELGVDTRVALQHMDDIAISLHCWQADDVGGFETPDSVLGGGGIQVTGNYPGKACNIDELMQDIDKVMSLLPGNSGWNMSDAAGLLLPKCEGNWAHLP